MGSNPPGTDKDAAPSWLAQPLPAPPPPVPPPAEPEPAPSFAWAPAPPRSSNRILIYGAGFLLLAIVGLGGWAARNQFAAFGSDASNSAPTPSPCCEYARANTFLDTKLGPSLDAVAQTLPAVEASCKGSFPVSCRNAIAVTDQKMRDTLAVVDQGDIPLCIEVPVQRFQADLAAMESGLSLALSGYQQNDRSTIIQGLQRFGTYAQNLRPDANSIDTAVKACPK